jgi:hypothetical protein
MIIRMINESKDDMNKDWMNSKKTHSAEWNKEDNAGYERGIR